MDLDLAYGSIFRKLDELIAEMEALAEAGINKDLLLFSVIVFLIVFMYTIMYAT